MTGPQATRAAVQSQWTNSSVALFACHGRSVPTEPLRSHLVLADGELSLVDLSTARAETAPAVVFASACETAAVDVSEVPDEFVGLPAGFLLSGVGSFVGTLWPTGDVPAALMTLRMIELMYPASGGGKSPARALQLSRTWLRELTTTNSWPSPTPRPSYEPQRAHNLPLRHGFRTSDPLPRLQHGRPTS